MKRIRSQTPRFNQVYPKTPDSARNELMGSRWHQAEVAFIPEGFDDMRDNRANRWKT